MKRRAERGFSVIDRISHPRSPRTGSHRRVHGGQRLGRSDRGELGHRAHQAHRLRIVREELHERRKLNSTPSGEKGVIESNLLRTRLLGPVEGAAWTQLTSAEHEPYVSEFSCEGTVFRDIRLAQRGAARRRERIECRPARRRSPTAARTSSWWRTGHLDQRLRKWRVELGWARPVVGAHESHDHGGIADRDQALARPALAGRCGGRGVRCAPRRSAMHLDSAARNALLLVSRALVSKVGLWPDVRGSGKAHAVFTHARGELLQLRFDRAAVHVAQRRYPGNCAGGGEAAAAFLEDLFIARLADALRQRSRGPALPRYRPCRSAAGCRSSSGIR